jgi:hypothetical protein
VHFEIWKPNDAGFRNSYLQALRNKGGNYYCIYPIKPTQNRKMKYLIYLGNTLWIFASCIIRKIRASGWNDMEDGSCWFHPARFKTASVMNFRSLLCYFYFQCNSNGKSFQNACVHVTTVYLVNYVCACV